MISHLILIMTWNISPLRASDADDTNTLGNIWIAMLCVFELRYDGPSQHIPINFGISWNTLGTFEDLNIILRDIHKLYWQLPGNGVGLLLLTSTFWSAGECLQLPAADHKITPDIPHCVMIRITCPLPDGLIIFSGCESGSIIIQTSIYLQCLQSGTSPSCPGS